MDENVFGGPSALGKGQASRKPGASTVMRRCPGTEILTWGGGRSFGKYLEYGLEGFPMCLFLALYPLGGMTIIGI